MEWTILAKAVPDADRVAVDLARGRLLREGAELFLNPFDQRALRLALDRRRDGERVTVLSMGPPSAREAFRDALALGADRAVLVSDPALAGSDSLVTARVLVAALRRLDAPLVLTGRWSTDSETGQVPAQVAALLARPYLPSARALEIVEGGRVRVVSDTETGWVRQSVPLPAVVAVGEKIVALRKPTDEARASVDLSRVEAWSVADLGLRPADVGEAASPTRVARVLEVAPTRRPVLCDAGSPAERVGRALALLDERLARTPAPSPAPPRADGAAVRVLVSGASGSLESPGLAALSMAVAQLPGGSIEGLWVGGEPGPDELRRVGAAGAASLRFTPARGRVDERRAATAIAAHLGDPPVPSGLVFPATEFGRAVAGRLSATLGLGLTGDAIDLAASEGGALLGRKPAFGGRYLAEIESRQAPALFTVRAGAGPAPSGAAPVPLRRAAAELPEPAALFEAEGREVEAGARDLDGAALVVGVGQGVGGVAGVEGVRRLADAWGAAIAASRKVVDSGWLPRQCQVGLTGRSLAPRLAVLVATSARSNQLIGYRRAGTVLVLTRDPEAAARAEADVVVVGDFEELLRELDRQGGARLRGIAAGAA